MFERYTEKARRVIFFARYEASSYGSPEIDTEHLLLGLLREEKLVPRWLPKVSPEVIRQRIETVTEKRKKISTAVDLPLTNAARRVLKHAADEADRLAHRHIGTEHLLLGLLDEDTGLAARLLREYGANDVELRKKFAVERGSVFERGRLLSQSRFDSPHGRGYRSLSGEIVEIHGVRWNADYIRDCVKRAKTYNWHWQKSPWKPRDIVVNRKNGSPSFDLTLAQDPAAFELIKQGWKKDHCFICRWELFESQDDHGTGYTNGHDWLCTDCFEKFWQRPDFFSSSYPEIT
jgi:hypothetical protein